MCKFWHNKHSDWSLPVSKIELCLNTKADSTSFIPYKLVYRKRPNERILDQLFEYPIESKKDEQIKIILTKDKLLAKGEECTHEHGQNVKSTIGAIGINKKSWSMDKEI